MCSHATAACAGLPQWLSAGLPQWLNASVGMGQQHAGEGDPGCPIKVETETGHVSGRPI